MRLSLVFACLLTAASIQAATVTTIAGTPGVAGYWDGPASDAMFAHPTWLYVVANDPNAYSCERGTSGEIFVVDRINHQVRRVEPDGTTSTFAVRPFFPPSPSPTPIALDFDSAFGGGIMVEPPGSGCGCGIYARGVMLGRSGDHLLTLAAMDGELASRDQFVTIDTGAGSLPSGIGHSPNFGTDRLGAGVYSWLLYYADAAQHVIVRVHYGLSGEGCPIPGTTEVLVGSRGVPGSADGSGSSARFFIPRGLAVAKDGNVYVSDAGNHTIRRITPGGVVTTVAGEPGVSGSNDGPARQAHLNTPSGIDVDADGNVFIVDTFNHTIRELTTDGRLITVAGRTGISGFADGDASTAMFNAPVGLKIAPDGSLIVADTGNNVIRRVVLQH